MMAKFHKAMDTMVGVHLNAHVMGEYGPVQLSTELINHDFVIEKEDTSSSCKTVCFCTHLEEGPTRLIEPR